MKVVFALTAAAVAVLGVLASQVLLKNPQPLDVAAGKAVAAISVPQQARATAIPKAPAKKARCATHHDASRMGWIPDDDCSPSVRAQLKAAGESMRTMRDFFATGSKTASAEWHSINNEKVTCGITPTDRYFIVENGIGKTKYDEPSDTDWVNLGCQATEPTRQPQAEVEIARQTNDALKHQSEAIEALGAELEADYRAREAKHEAWEKCNDNTLASLSPSDDYAQRVKQACGKEPPQ